MVKGLGMRKRLRRNAAVMGAIGIFMGGWSGLPANAAPTPAQGIASVVDLSPGSLALEKPSTRHERSGPGKWTDEDRIPESGIEFVTDLRSANDVGKNIVLPGVAESPVAESSKSPKRGTTRVLRQGSRGDGMTTGCTFRGAVRMSSPAEVTVSELSRDESRCLSLVEITVSDPSPIEVAPAGATHVYAPERPRTTSNLRSRRAGITATANTGTGTYVAKRVRRRANSSTGC